MKYHAPSRRMFLSGAGAALVLPFLPSLLPRGVKAETVTRPVRYIQVQNPYGPTAKLFYGQRTTKQRVSPNVNVEDLTAIDGPISTIFGNEWNPFKSRMSLLSGIDVLSRNPNHHYCMTTCASSYDEGLDGDNIAPSSGQPSLDYIMSASAKVYGGNVPQARRLVALNPVTTDDYSSNRSFSWRPGSSGLSMVSPIKQTDAFYGVFSSGFGEATVVDPREQALISGVWDDFKRVRDGNRISSADKKRLDAYMGLINDITAGAAQCEVPDRPQESSVEIRIDNQFRLLAAAMVCDLTRVGSIVLGMSAGGNPRHDEHHGLMGAEDRGEENGLHKDFVLIGQRIARLATILDGIDEGAGTLLDYTVIYYSMQYGCMSGSDQHTTKNMALMLAGGGGGMLSQGRYIDYAKELGGGVTADNRMGIPINNLLVTLMNTMGLSSEDYEPEGRRGYGDYPPGVAATNERPNYDFWLSDAGKRAALPVIYNGPARG